MIIRNADTARTAFLLILLGVVLTCGGPVLAVQIDRTGDDSIDHQWWQLQFTVHVSSEDSFYVRLPYPYYKVAYKWSEYRTEEIAVDVEGSCGPIEYILYYYNPDYSNSGVWVKVMNPCEDNVVTLRVKQSADLHLPGISQPLTHQVHNNWMSGTSVVDVNNSAVAQALVQALDLPGDWHTGGHRAETEQVVNWLNKNVSWEEVDAYEPYPASWVLTQRRGNCDEWAHAACALMLKAGIPAKYVMVGAIPSSNATGMKFDDAGLHAPVAYWDGFGWILIDPRMTSGFTWISRVILGADQDETGVRIELAPDYLQYATSDEVYSYDSGSESGYLTTYPWRCTQYSWEILEHYEKLNDQGALSVEPRSDIIPIELTAVENESAPWIHDVLSNYPNPCNPGSFFNVKLRRPGRVQLDLFSIDGKLVANIWTGWMQSGRQTLYWDSRGVPSGIYVARLRCPLGTTARKIVVLK